MQSVLGPAVEKIGVISGSLYLLTYKDTLILKNNFVVRTIHVSNKAANKQ